MAIFAAAALLGIFIGLLRPHALAVGLSSGLLVCCGLILWRTGGMTGWMLLLVMPAALALHQAAFLAAACFYDPRQIRATPGLDAASDERLGAAARDLKSLAREMRAADGRAEEAVDAENEPRRRRA